MGNPWDAEHPVDAALAARLIEGQFPDLPGGPLVRLGQGWDNDIWRRGAITWRFPRRSMGRRLLRTEARVLPALAPRLPLPIPWPRYLGEATAEYPSAFLGHPFVSGTTGDRAALSAAERGALAETLGAFLRALHAVDPDEAAAMGVGPDRFRWDMGRARALVVERAEALLGGRWDEGLRAAMAAEVPPSVRGGTLLHGDLYLRHLLFDEERALCGVIDWGDVCIGDRAQDLFSVYAGLPPEARPRFWAAYGEVDGGTRARARYIALKYATALLAYASDVGDAPLLAEAEVALEYALL